MNQWLELIFYNLICPAVPFPLIVAARVESIMATTAVSPVWLVVIVANAIGGLGLLPIAFVIRRFGAERVDRLLQRWPKIVSLRARHRQHMFWLQIGLNCTLLPDYVGGALAGIERYSLPRLWLAQLIGRTAHNLPIALVGLWAAKQPWYNLIHQVFAHPLVQIATVVAVVLTLSWKLLQEWLHRFMVRLKQEVEQ